MLLVSVAIHTYDIVSACFKQKKWEREKEISREGGHREKDENLRRISWFRFLRRQYVTRHCCGFCATAVRNLITAVVLESVHDNQNSSRYFFGSRCFCAPNTRLFCPFMIRLVLKMWNLIVVYRLLKYFSFLQKKLVSLKAGSFWYDQQFNAHNLFKFTTFVNLRVSFCAFYTNVCVPLIFKQWDFKFLLYKCKRSSICMVRKNQVIATQGVHSHSLYFFILLFVILQVSVPYRRVS